MHLGGGGGEAGAIVYRLVNGPPSFCPVEHSGCMTLFPPGSDYPHPGSTALGNYVGCSMGCVCGGVYGGLPVHWVPAASWGRAGGMCSRAPPGGMVQVKVKSHLAVPAVFCIWITLCDIAPN